MDIGCAQGCASIVYCIATANVNWAPWKVVLWTKWSARIIITDTDTDTDTAAWRVRPSYTRP